MPKVNTVKKAQKDYPKHGIKKGDTYYWWAFRHGGKHMSKTYPKPSQLTQSEYLAQIYEMQDEIAQFTPNDVGDVESFVDDMKSRLEELRDEQESKRDNMPESLRESDTGQLLQERYDNCNNAYNEFDNIECDYDEPGDEDLREEAIEYLELEDAESLTDEQKAEIETKIDELRQEKLKEWLDEKVQEIQNISIE